MIQSSNLHRALEITNNAVAREKYLINCQDGVNKPERATISFVLAFTASKTCETAVFVSANIAQLCVKGGAAGIKAEGYEPLLDLLNGFLDNGGKT
jgi:predicted peroxiredoxin